MNRDFFIRKKKQVPTTENRPVVLDLSSEETSKEDKMQEYLKAFVKPRVLTGRKSVYISQDIHEFISKVVNKLGVRNMTVGVFIDTVLAQHITEHMDELRDIYYREEGDVFKNIVKNRDDD